MYTKSAAFYDTVYRAVGKDYAHEAAFVLGLAREHAHRPIHSVLDAACGTGMHLAEFARAGLTVSGFDLETRFVDLSRARLGDANIFPADFLTFASDSKYDLVTCLFGAIAHARVVKNLERAIGNLARAVAPGGVLIVEGWVDLRDFRPGALDALFVDEPETKIARMSQSRQVGTIATIDMHFMTGSRHGIERLTERHELGLWSDADYDGAFAAAGMTCEHVQPPQAESSGERTPFRRLHIGVR